MKNYEKKSQKLNESVYNKQYRGSRQPKHGKRKEDILNILNELQKAENEQITTFTDEGLYNRFLDYLDIKPKSIETYRTAIRQFLKYLVENGIRKPQRKDIAAYRDYLERSHKPTTVHNYLVVVKFFSMVKAGRALQGYNQKCKSTQNRQGAQKGLLNRPSMQTALRFHEYRHIKGQA